MKEINRRTLLKGAAGAAVAATAGGTAAAAAPATFTHPGALHNWGDLNRAKVRVAAGDDPWLSGYNKLIANTHAQSTWQPNPQATIIRGGTGQNYGILYNDIHAAYQNALRWWITGSTAHGDCARNILNAWSATLTSVTGNADRFLAAGLYGYQFANVAELMRGYSGFDLARFKTMLLNVFYPLNNSFLINHNDACITNYWANWDLCTMNSILAIAILCDDGAKYDQAVDYFKNGAGNGAIRNAIPFVYDSEGLAQWQEAGRDQGHTVMGIGQMGAFCEMAWNQGEDLYGYDNNRFLKAAQYVAKYNLGQDVPFTRYSWGTGQNCAYQEHTVISSASRGQLRPVWEMLHFHYTRRKFLSVPYISQMAALVRPEGGGGDYGSTSGGFDQTGFGTVMYAK
ncbi:alginate lyase family protein [Kribbella sp. NPDC002412]